jgi:hypothetical protein
MYFIYLFVLGFSYSISAPVSNNYHTNTLRNFKKIFPDLFNINSFGIENNLKKTETFTKFIPPKISKHCIYASINTILTSDDSILPTDCGLISVASTTDTLFQRMSAEVGTFACMSTSRDNCLPILSKYELETVFDAIPESSTAGFYHGGVRHEIQYTMDKKFFSLFQILRDEITQQFYWTSVYCLQFMSVTTDEKFINVGASVKFFDGPNHHFCISNYQKFCTPAGPFDNVRHLISSLPIEITVYSKTSFVFFLNSDVKFDMDVKRSIIYDANSYFDLDKNSNYINVRAQKQEWKGDIICVKYHTVPFTSIFHFDTIVNAIEDKFLSYFFFLKEFFLNKIIPYIQKYFLKVLSWFFSLLESIISKIFEYSVLHDLINSFILLIFLFVTNNNYSTTILILTIFHFLSYILNRN